MIIDLIVNYIKRTRYFIVLVRKEYNAFMISQIKEIKLTNEKLLKIGTNQYNLNLDKPTYLKKTERYYFFDELNGSQLLMDGTNPNLTPIELDMIVGQKIIKELTSGVVDNKKDKIFNVIVGMILGGLIASLIVMVIYNEKIEQILTEQNANTVDFNTFKTLGMMLK